MARLIGRDRQCLADAPLAFRPGQRRASVLNRIAKGRNQQEILAISAWYAEQK